MLTDLDLLARLVSFDSTSSKSNVPLADFICEYAGSGASITRVPSPIEPKTTLVIRFGPETTDDRDGLILSGHMDVVPALEPDWKSNPFELTEREGRLHGRGAADMKGFLAIALNAAVRMAKQRLRAPLVLIYTYDEEVGTLGAKQFLEQWPKENVLPRNTVIGEPTSLRAVVAHKGHAKVTIRTRGQNAHSGYPHLGRNAIEPMVKIIVALSKLREELESVRTAASSLFSTVPYPPLNLGVVQGGTAVNIVPAACQLDVGFRGLPGMDATEVIERIREAARDAAECEADLISNSPPFHLRVGSNIEPIVRAHAVDSTDRTVNFATDAGWLQQLDLDCIIFGPGTIEVAHRANEFVPMDELARGARILDAMIRQCCIEEER